MNTLMAPGERYGERKLAELLEFATSDLQPGSGYKLILEGVRAKTLTYKELEAFFGATLDPEAGAHIELGYDESTAQMVLQELTLPIKGIDGVAKIFRTETIGYIPVLEIRDQPFRARSEFMSYQDGQALLAGFGIEDIPAEDPEAYAQWREEVLSKTSGWNLTERLEIPQAVDLNSAQVVTLMHQESLNLANFEMNESRSLTRSIVLFYDTDSHTDHIDVTLETSATAGDKQFTMFKQVYSRSPDPIVINDAALTQSKLEPITLDRNSYQDFENVLLEVIHQRRATPENV